MISSTTLLNCLANCKLADLVRCRLHPPRYQAGRIPRIGRYCPDLPRRGASLAILQQTPCQVVAGRLRVRSCKQGKSIDCMVSLFMTVSSRMQLPVPNAICRRSLLYTRFLSFFIRHKPQRRRLHILYRPYFWNSQSLLSRGQTDRAFNHREMQWKWNAC